MVLGMAGLWIGWSSVRRRVIDDRWVLLARAASLVAGLVIFGRVYGQYLTMFFPHLAVFGAASAPQIVRRMGRWLTPRRWLSVTLLLLPFAACVALLVGLDAPASATGLTM